MLFRLACLTVTNAFAALRLPPMSDRDKDVEILALRHQLTVLERRLGAGARVGFAPEDRAFLAALLTSPPREVLRRLRLLVRPDTVLRRHRDLMRRRHTRTCRPKGKGLMVRSIQGAIAPGSFAYELGDAQYNCSTPARRVAGDRWNSPGPAPGDAC
ncbi:hypothetical protein GCM10027187_48950 [Streptosporangium sandarakinum]